VWKHLCIQYFVSRFRSAHLMAAYRPRCPIIAVTRDGVTARQLHLYRGVFPIHYTGRFLFYKLFLSFKILLSIYNIWKFESCEIWCVRRWHYCLFLVYDLCFILIGLWMCFSLGFVFVCGFPDLTAPFLSLSLIVISPPVALLVYHYIDPLQF
jgi:hypothetical protein